VSILADLLSTVFERRYKNTAGGKLDKRPINALCDDLLGRHGEVSGVALA